MQGMKMEGKQGRRQRERERGGRHEGEARRALISPWPPSLGFLHSG